MKNIIISLIALFALVGLTGCQTANVNQYGGSGGGHYVTETVPCPARVDLSYFGNQPRTPTPAAMANPTTWGEVYGNALCANEGKGDALVQNLNPQAAIYFDRQNQWAWGRDCDNRRKPYTPETRQRWVAAPGGGGNYSNINQSQKFNFDLNIPIDVSINGGEGGSYSRGCYQQPQRQQFRTCQVPIRDRCGRIVGHRTIRVPAGGGGNYRGYSGNNYGGGYSGGYGGGYGYGGGGYSGGVQTAPGIRTLH